MADALMLWKQFLQVQEPWTVLECRTDEFNRSMDIWVGVEAPRGWFRLGRARPVESAPEVVWRHNGFNGWKLQIHVRPPVSGELPRHQWAGEVGMPFTRALDRQIMLLLKEGVSLIGIGALLDVPMPELWRYRHALDSGRHSVATLAQASTEPKLSAPVLPFPTEPARPTEPGRPAASRVPELSDPVWLRLVEGSLDIQVRVLGLQLLLARTRAQVAVIADEEVRMLKLGELRRYFLKNERMLAHELEQIVGEAA